MLDLGYVYICVFIADCEYSLALVQHGLPVQARGWLRPWPGITCTQTTIQPNPLPSPFTDLPWTFLLLSNISYLLSPFSWLAVWHFLVFETAGVSFQTERWCQNERSGLFPFWNKWSVVSEWAPVSQDDRRHTFQRREEGPRRAAGVLWQSKSSELINFTLSLNSSNICTSKCAFLRL